MPQLKDERAEEETYVYHVCHLYDIVYKRKEKIYNNESHYNAVKLKKRYSGAIFSTNVDCFAFKFSVGKARWSKLIFDFSWHWWFSWFPSTSLISNIRNQFALSCRNTTINTCDTWANEKEEKIAWEKNKEKGKEQWTWIMLLSHSGKKWNYSEKTCITHMLCIYEDTVETRIICETTLIFLHCTCIAREIKLFVSIVFQ